MGRDLCGPEGLTTENFIAAVQDRFNGEDIADLQKKYNVKAIKQDAVRPKVDKDDVDFEAIQAMFNLYDTDESGSIDVGEFGEMMIKLGVAPKTKDSLKSVKI